MSMGGTSQAAHAGDGADPHALRLHLEQRTGLPVELIETHISWVLLAGERAYKLKKAVRLPFVDATALAARRHLCMEELRLNRRLAAPVYLGMLPVMGSPQAPRLDGHGAAVDHLVCMRRFAQGALASEMLRDGRLQAADLGRFARRLAGFHRHAHVQRGDGPGGSPAHIRSSAHGVLAQLQPFAAAAEVDALRFWLDTQADALAPAWAQRLREGHVRECHGDLHLDNLACIDGEITAFDCLEFDVALRTIDTISDVAFTTMDLKARGRADLAHGWLDDYLQASGDYAGVTVLPYYEVCRALVRALVGALRRPGGGAAEHGVPYLAWARQAACAGTREPPMLLLMHGLSGSGKSTVARALVERSGAVRLRSDVERKRLAGPNATASSANAPRALYGSAMSGRTYMRLRALASQLLASGCSVIVDAAFLRHEQRSAFQLLAQAAGVPFAIVHCEAPQQALLQRLRTRAAAGVDPSDADAQVLAVQVAQQEPLSAQEAGRAVSVSTERLPDAAELLRQVRRAAASGQLRVR
jgi:aminoglycoside phosphotransferase family enzyme/predicted kinase